MSATGRQGRSSAVDRQRRLQELDRQTAEEEAREQRERVAQAQAQRQAQDKRDAQVRAQAHEAAQRLAQARSAAEWAAGQFEDVARAFVAGSVDEEAVLAADRKRQTTRVLLEASELGHAALRAHPAISGRR